MAPILHDDIESTIAMLWDSDDGDRLWRWWLDFCGATEALGLKPFYDEERFYELMAQIEDVEGRWDEVDRPWQFVWLLHFWASWAKDCIEERGGGERTPGHVDYWEEVADWTHTHDEMVQWTLEVFRSNLQFGGTIEQDLKKLNDEDMRLRIGD